jgi:hypothetical protein
LNGARRVEAQPGFKFLDEGRIADLGRVSRQDKREDLLHLRLARARSARMDTPFTEVLNRHGCTL